MIKSALMILLCALAACCAAQNTLLSNKTLAEEQIMQLHGGVLVVRLKTYAKSVAAYRASGQNKLADKLERNYRISNLFLMKAFLENMDFCRVMFIKAEDSRKLVAHEPYIFLNEKLQVDSSIQLPTKPIFIAEYGELMSNDRTSDKSFVVKQTEATASEGAASAIVISDTSFTQLKEPFPFYSVIGVADEALPVIAPRINGAPVDTGAWSMATNGAATPQAKVNPIWKKDIYERGVKHLNKELIGYYCKVNKKTGKVVSDDVVQWEHNDPNKDVDVRLRLLTEQIIKMEDAHSEK